MILQLKYMEYNSFNVLYHLRPQFSKQNFASVKDSRWSGRARTTPAPVGLKH